MQANIEQIGLKIGGYKLYAVPTGIFGLDGGAMFGTVPKVLWQKTNPADEQNRIAMEARALLLVNDTHKILIDCGNGGDFIAKYGEKLGAKFAQLYNIDSSQPVSLERSLSALQISFDDITDVIFTHLHFDHCGGAVRYDGSKLVPTFRNARYYVQKANLETAMKPNSRERASYFSSNFKPLIDAGRMQILDGACEILPHVSVIISNGHTQGQQLVKISDGEKTVVYCGDLVPTSSHAKAAWVMGYDLYPLMIIEEKTKLLEQASRENWYLFFEHDPYCDLATVVREGHDFSVSHRYWLSGK